MKTKFHFEISGRISQTDLWNACGEREREMLSTRRGTNGGRGFLYKQTKTKKNGGFGYEKRVNKK